MRAGCPDASWITRTTLLPSTTTQTASSSDQLGRDSVRPSIACDALPPSGPTHSDDAMSGAPGRSVTIDATSWPVRDTAAAVWLGISPNGPGTRGARWPSSDTQRPTHQRVQARRGAVGRARVGGRDVGGLPAVGEPVVERRTVGVDHIRAVDACPRQASK